MSDEKVAAAKAKVQRLLDACFIHEVQYPTWLANVVMVKKKNGKWRMCTNFTDLNKCYPKDDFPLSRITMVGMAIDNVRYATMTMLFINSSLKYHLLMANMILVLIFLENWLLNKNLHTLNFLKMLGLE
jgi:hypothetical protein